MTGRATSRSPTREELIRLAIKQNQSEQHTSLPGEIQVYDATQQKADIQILLKRPLVANDGTSIDAESIPLLMDVPVCFDRGGQGTGAFFTSYPLTRGDLVHVHFIERSIDQWLAKTGEETDPQDFRMHNLSDAVAYPCLYPRARALKGAHAANMVMGKDLGSQIHIKPDGQIHMGSEFASQFVALAQKVFDEINSLRTTVNANATALASHIHITTATVGPTPTPGIISPTVTPVTTPAAVKQVAATKVKAD